METKRVCPARAAAVPVLLVILVCALPSLYLYCNNAYELTLSAVALPLFASVALGLICLLALWLISRNLPFATLVTVVAMALFLNFNFVVSLVDAVWPHARVRVYYIVAAVIFFALLFLLLRLRRNGELPTILTRLLLIASVVVLAFNIVNAVPDAARRRSATAFASSEVAPQAERPNLYYLIADEYASFSEIKTYYDYDNSAFRDALAGLGFSVSEDSYNRGGGTMRNMADNVNLGPVSTDDMTLADYTDLFNNGTLYGALEGMGYSLSQLGSLYPLPQILEQESFSIDSGAATMNGESAAELLVKNSMLMPLPTMLYWRMVADEGDLAVFNWLDDAANYTSPGGRAIFLYICSPHPPFYYDADGGRVDAANWTNWTDTRYYLDQYQYITRRLETTVRSIIANDPGAIILLQSDHGLRYHEDSDLPHTFWIETDDQHRILNALYYGGERVDIAGLSGYNTWRYVLTRLGGDYPILPEK